MIDIDSADLTLGIVGKGSLGQGLHGTVRISVPSGYGQMRMAGWFMEFMELHPQTTLEVIFDNDIEDFSTGWADSKTVKDDPTAVRRCWHLAWSSSEET